MTSQSQPDSGNREPSGFKGWVCGSCGMPKRLSEKVCAECGSTEVGWTDGDGSWSVGGEVRTQPTDPPAPAPPRRPLFPKAFAGVVLGAAVGTFVVAITALYASGHTEGGCLRFTAEEEKMATRLSLILAPIAGVVSAVVGGLLGRRGKQPTAAPRTKSITLLVLVSLGAMALMLFFAVVVAAFASGNC